MSERRMSKEQRVGVTEYCRNFSDSDVRFHTTEVLVDKLNASHDAADAEIASLKARVKRYDDLLKQAQAFMSTQPLNTLFDVIDIGVRHCFARDYEELEPDEEQVLSIVAAGVMLADHYGYTFDDILRRWQERGEES